MSRWYDALTGDREGTIKLDAPTRKGRFRLPVGIVLASPTLIFLAIFMVYPVGNLVYLSFRCVPLA